MLSRFVAKRNVGLPATRLLGAKAGHAESYTERQAKLGRPLSPHVTIYKFPAAALTSIVNRVTGVALSAGLTGIGAASLAGCDVIGLVNTIAASPVAPVAKLVVAFPLVYHYLGGIRHFIWDKNPEPTLNNESVERASYVLAGSSAVVSVGLALLTV